MRISSGGRWGLRNAGLPDSGARSTIDSKTLEIRSAPQSTLNEPSIGSKARVAVSVRAPLILEGCPAHRSMYSSCTDWSISPRHRVAARLAYE